LHMYCFVCADDLMKPYSPIWVVRMWRGIHADHVLRCLVDLEGLNNGDVLDVGMVKLSYPGSKKHRTEASIRVPRMFNHTHSNNMINR
jgi:hypothetical protein